MNYKATTNVSEAAVIGCLITDSDGTLTEKMLALGIGVDYFPNFGKAVGIILKSFSDGEAPAYSTLKAKMLATGVPDSDALRFLQAKDPTAFDANLRVLATEYRRMVEMEIAETALAELQSGGDPEAVEAMTMQMRERMVGEKQNEKETRAREVAGVIDSLHRARSGKKSVGHSTGINALDKLVGGMGVGGRLYIVAARPGMGKSTLVQTICTNLAALGCPTGLVSLEMPFQELAKKYMQQQTAISRRDMNAGRLTDIDFGKINNAAAKLYELPFYTCTETRDINRVLQTARTWVRKYGVKVLAVDYMQLITDYTQRYSRDDLRIDAIAESFATFAIIENCDVILLSQLSRAVETRGGNKRPTLSDLRGSGGIEQAAGRVLFLNRPDYYGIKEDENGRPTDGVVTVEMPKDRYEGSIGEVTIMYDHWRDLYCDEIAEQPQGVVYNPLISPINHGADEVDIPF